jgi:hypothetical protein
VDGWFLPHVHQFAGLNELDGNFVSSFVVVELELGHSGMMRIPLDVILKWSGE